MRIAGMDASTTAPATGQLKQGQINTPAPVTQKTNASDNQPQQRNSIDKAEKPVDEKSVSEAAGKMNKLLEGTNRRCEISVHEKTHEIMVKVIDDATGEVIREVPPKKILDMIANMLEMAGLIVDERR